MPSVRQQSAEATSLILSSRFRRLHGIDRLMAKWSEQDRDTFDPIIRYYLYCDFRLIAGFVNIAGGFEYGLRPLNGFKLFQH